MGLDWTEIPQKDLKAKYPIYPIINEYHAEGHFGMSTLVRIQRDGVYYLVLCFNRWVCDGLDIVTLYPFVQQFISACYRVEHFYLVDPGDSIVDDNQEDLKLIF